MPVKRGKDINGPFFQWGNEKKYYYKTGDPKSRITAKKKAEKQGRAIKFSETHK